MRSGHFFGCVTAITLSLGAPPLAAASGDAQPAGSHAQIDTQLLGETVLALAKGTEEQQQQAIAQVRATPDRYAPPVFYALADRLFRRGERAEAAFWFHAGQLRARFDANRCADRTARQAVDVLDQQYGVLNQYDAAKLEQLIPQVIDFDRHTAHHYDQRWINLRSLNAAHSGLRGESLRAAAPLSLPEARWEQIAEQTREQYLADCKEALALMKKRETPVQPEGR